MQLIVSAGIILAIVLWGVLEPDSPGSVFDTLLAVIARDFGWLYLWVVLGLVVLAMVLAFSRYGDLKLGAEDDEPEFSLGSWFAMLFAAGMGIGLVFWGVAEPISHYGAPPPASQPTHLRLPPLPCATASSTGVCIPGRSTASWHWPSPSSSSAGAAPRW